MRLPLQIGVAVVVLASAATAQAQMRFQGMDTNGDGVITRSEWRGNDNSFRNQDWNGDGILSGDEVRTGARRQTDWSQDWNQDGRVDNLDSQIAQRFRGYDMNSDNRVGTQRVARRRASVHAPRREPRRLPLDAGIHAGWRVHASTRSGGPSYRFSNIDANRRRLVTRNEWNMSNADFNRLDVNRDNRVSRFEFENAGNRIRYDVRQKPQRRVAHRLRPGNPGGSSRGPRGFHSPPGLGFGGPARARAGGLGIHTTDGHAERLSGWLSRGVQDRLSRGLRGSRWEAAAVGIGV